MSIIIKAKGPTELTADPDALLKGGREVLKPVFLVAIASKRMLSYRLKIL